MKQAIQVSTDATIKPFKINIPENEIQDLKNRLRNSRWPSKIRGDDWQYGVPVDYLKKLADYWLLKFDWKTQENKINQYPQFVTEIDGVSIHFLHIKSPEPDALALVMTHGWPGSFVEFINVIEPLTNPVAYGGNRKDAFHLIIPSIPGFGFSAPPPDAGWNLKRIAQAWAELMDRLGYEKYAVQGGDAGIGISVELSHEAKGKVVGIHMNGPVLFPYGGAENLTLSESDQKRYDRLKQWQTDGMGYLQIKSTRPHTLGYALIDSPTGQLAWIVEKFKEWTDPSAPLPEDAVDLDLLLTNVSIYWFTGTAPSSSRLLYETMHTGGWPAPPTVPTGVAVFAGDNTVKAFSGATNDGGHWSEYDKGGHFASMEVPELFVKDVRKFFQSFR